MCPKMGLLDCNVSWNRYAYDVQMYLQLGLQYSGNFQDWKLSMERE